MKIPETKQQIVSEIDAWENIIHSDSWAVYVRFLKEHIIYLQKEMNNRVEKQDFYGASATLGAIRDSQGMLDSVTKRLEILRKNAEKGA